MNSVPRLSPLNRYICPICGKPATLKGKLVWLRPMNYMAVIHCAKHSIKVTVRFEKKADREYQWVKRYALSDEKDEELYASLIKDKPPLPAAPDKAGRTDKRPATRRNTRRKPGISDERKNNG